MQLPSQLSFSQLLFCDPLILFVSPPQQQETMDSSFQLLRAGWPEIFQNAQQAEAHGMTAPVTSVFPYVRADFPQYFATEHVPSVAPHPQGRQ